MSSDSPKDLAHSVNKLSVEEKSKPSHIMEGDYAILQEFNDKESECWLYFIRRERNEEVLRHLQKQLESFDQVMMEDMSTFTIELEPWVSARTAKEMTKIDLNSCSFHRKFDGKLQTIDFDFKKKNSDETKMCKIFDQLSYGQIEDYISDEDLDPGDLVDHSTSDDESDDSSKEESPAKRKGNIPRSLVKTEIHRWARAKQDSTKKNT